MLVQLIIVVVRMFQLGKVVSHIHHVDSFHTLEGARASLAELPIGVAKRYACEGEPVANDLSKEVVERMAGHQGDIQVTCEVRYVDVAVG